MALPFVWKCDNSVLIGTSHLTKKDYQSDIEKLMIEYGIETILIETDISSEMSLEQFIAEPGHRIEDLLKPIELDAFKKIVMQIGLSFEELRPLKLLVIGMLIAGKVYQGFPIELQILDVAKKLNIHIAYLETNAEQIAALESAKEANFVENIRWMINNFRNYKRAFTDLDKAFASGNEQTILTLMTLVYPVSAYTIKVLQRNKRFAERALPYIKRGKCAIAVGVGHLIGKRSLQYFIQKYGISSKRVI